MAVVGASGYAGAELVGLLAGHPEVDVVGTFAHSYAGQAFERLFPRLRHLHRGVMHAFDPDLIAGVDLVCLALPQGKSALAAKALHGRVGHIIDLGGDLRMRNARTWEHAYGQTHPAPELLGEAVYGLPELFGDDLPGARLVACAGCYATVAQLAAAPAFALGTTLRPKVRVHATSGSSGAGRKAEVALGFSELSGDLRAYRVGSHQHVAEIRAGLERLCGGDVPVGFTPHLAPIERGILADVVLEANRPLHAATILATWRAAYRDSPFVRVVDPADRLPSVRDVARTPYCDLAPVVDSQTGDLVVIGVIDNLMKGAASQAVQVANRVLGFDERVGLIPADLLNRAAKPANTAITPPGASS